MSNDNTQINLTETNEFLSFPPLNGLKKFIVTYIASDETSHSVLVSYNEETGAYETKGTDAAVMVISDEVQIDKSFIKAGSSITVSTVPEKETVVEDTPTPPTPTGPADAVTVKPPQQGQPPFLSITPGANNRLIKVTYTSKEGDTLHMDTYEKSDTGSELWKLHVKGEGGEVTDKISTSIPLQVDITKAKPDTRIYIVASTGTYGDLEYTATYDVPAKEEVVTVSEESPVDNKELEMKSHEDNYTPKEPKEVQPAPIEGPDKENENGHQQDLKESNAGSPAAPPMENDQKKETDPSTGSHPKGEGEETADTTGNSGNGESGKSVTPIPEESKQEERPSKDPSVTVEPKEADLPLLEEVENTRILAVTPGNDNTSMVITLSSLDKDEEVLITAKKQNDTWVLDNQDTYLKYIIDVKGNGQGFLINLDYVVNGSLIKIMASNSHGGAYVNGITYTNHFKKPRTLEEELVPESSALPLGYVTNMSELYEIHHLVTDIIKDLLEKPANTLKEKWGVSKLQPILFLDLETTGLNPAKDRLLEFHAIFTYFDKESGKFIKLLEVGNTFFCNVPAISDGVAQAVVDMHFDNGLWKDCYHSNISGKYDEDKVRYHTFSRLVKAFGKYSGEYDAEEDRYRPVLVTLAGSSVHFDKAWIDQGHFGFDMQNRVISHRTLDATTFVLADSLHGIPRSTEEEDIPLLPERVRNGKKHRACFDIHLSLVRLERFLSRLEAPRQDD